MRVRVKVMPRGAVERVQAVDGVIAGVRVDDVAQAPKP
jgi:hypothetical protein